jgi:hypothetical protein
MRTCTIRGRRLSPWRRRHSHASNPLTFALLSLPMTVVLSTIAAAISALASALAAYFAYLSVRH